MIREAMRIAEEIGFEVCVPLNTEALCFREEVREMCRADRCQSYGKTWSCPPACGTLDELRERVAPFSCGILVETVGVMEDEFDYESVMEAAALHKERFLALSDALRKQYSAIFPMGAGRCTLCASCTYPTAPCRFPDKMTPSMEAAGLLVSDVCRLSNAPYYHGKNTTAFIGCVLL